MIQSTYFYVRLYVDGHEGERMRWPSDLLHEFSRCLRACRATGHRPTVNNITQLFIVPSFGMVVDLTAYRPFYRAYGRYIVDILAADGDDTCNLKIHKKR